MADISDSQIIHEPEFTIGYSHQIPYFATKYTHEICSITKLPVTYYNDLLSRYERARQVYFSKRKKESTV